MTKLSDEDRAFLETRMELEQMHLSIDTIAATLISMQTAISLLLSEAGTEWQALDLSEADKKRQMELATGIANRLMLITQLSAQLSDKEVDDEKLRENILGMLTRAVETKGESIEGENAVFHQVFEGAVKDDDVQAEPSIVDPLPDTDTHTNVKGEPEEVNDLMSLFRSARAEKVKKPDVTFDVDEIDENITMSGAFYNPETMPVTPEEFADYDKRAVEFFFNVLAEAEKAGTLSNSVARAVSVCLHGGEEFDVNDVAHPEGHITKLIVEQGHSDSHYRIVAGEERDISEAIIAAYSVSIARLRGAYVQAKLSELSDYMDSIDQTGVKI